MTDLPAPWTGSARRVGALLVTGLVLLGTLLVLAPATAAAAPEDPTWTLVPSSPSGPKGRKQFDYELSPKEQITDWFSVSNLGDRPITVDLYPTDAFTALDGGFALLPRSQAPSGVGSWIRLPKASTTLPPGKRADVPFRLAVPAGTAPGDHVGGIIAAVTEEQVGTDGQRVNVERRIGARVYLRVAGPLRPAAGVSTVQVEYDTPVVPLPGGRMMVTYRITNTGNVRISGKARVQVSGPFGVRLATGDLVEMPEVLPDSEIRLTEEFEHVLPAGPLTATVVLNADTPKESLPSLEGSGSTVAVPWALLMLLVLVLVVVAYRLWLRRARRLDTLPDEPAAPAREHERAGR
ncbi:WxL protein peptidoglycan domain-containing protein [Micromonospora sp. CA-259024]|uniref:WxL protein peptidoglycan domain-containing protein n=1 Tax=Micromonospora sp. CA-259024 TaxID=3239965 RepID=UPI003D93A567